MTDSHSHSNAASDSRCRSCGAGLDPGAAWCSLCHARVAPPAPQPQPQSLPTQRAPAVPMLPPPTGDPVATGPLLRPGPGDGRPLAGQPPVPEPVEGPPPYRSRSAALNPELTADAMVAQLAAAERDDSPTWLVRLADRRHRAAIMIGGALLIMVVLGVVMIAVTSVTS